MDANKMAQFDWITRETALLLGHGLAIMHGNYPADGKLSGRIQSDSNTQTLYLGNKVGESMEAAGIPLHTYEHNIAEGWKTIVPRFQRSALLAAIAESDRIRASQNELDLEDDQETQPAPAA